MIDRIPERLRRGGLINTTTGPELWRETIQKHTSVKVFEHTYFYPFDWFNKKSGVDFLEEYPEAYTAHHWRMSWKR